MDATSIVALIVAVAAPLGTYLVAARRFSGKIETSDARDLWAESRSIRKWSQDRIAELNGVIGRLEKRVRELETENYTLKAELERLK